MTLHFLDFEGNHRSGILEYGTVTLAGGRLVEPRTRLCRHKGRILPEESSVHGIRESELANFEPVEADWSLFSQLRSTGCFAAHHAPTEDSLLCQVWPFHRSAPDWTDPNRKTNAWGPWVDTCQLVRMLFPGLEANLEKLVRDWGLLGSLDKLAAQWCPPSRCSFHCALYDALASALIFLRLLTSLAPEQRTLDWLLIHSKGNLRERQRKLQTEFGF